MKIKKKNFFIFLNFFLRCFFCLHSSKKKKQKTLVSLSLLFFSSSALICKKKEIIKLNNAEKIKNTLKESGRSGVRVPRRAVGRGGDELRASSNSGSSSVACALRGRVASAERIARGSSEGRYSSSVTSRAAVGGRAVFRGGQAGGCEGFF